jgi:SAM-dependent methyltransferase
MNKTSEEIDWKKESRRFDGVAEFYAAYRPDYPDVLIECVISLTGIQKSGEILEIGSGTGKATALFAQRGYSILCIEPGENLVSVAKQNLANFPRIEFQECAFEDWNERTNEFDLVISAQAFHWVPKEIGYAKAARALKANGYLALFWNMYPYPKGGMYDDLSKVYKEQIPALATRTGSYEDLLKQREIEIIESGCFGTVEVRKFPWVTRYSTEQYLGLLNTYSDHLRLPEEDRNRLFESIAEVIERYGGYVEKPYMAVLYAAQKASQITLQRR